MIPLAGGGFSQSGSADANTNFGTLGLGGFGGINTGTQGLDIKTLALIVGALVVVVLLLVRK